MANHHPVQERGTRRQRRPARSREDPRDQGRISLSSIPTRLTRSIDFPFPSSRPARSDSNGDRRRRRQRKQLRRMRRTERKDLFGHSFASGINCYPAFSVWTFSLLPFARPFLDFSCWLGSLAARLFRIYAFLSHDLEETDKGCEL